MKRKYFQEIRLENQGDHEWEFEFPRVGDDELEELDEGIDYMARAPRVAEDIFRKLLKKTPEFIDARHHLALVCYRSPLFRQREARELWDEIADTLLAVAPAEFQIGRDRISWGMIENRPYLRAMHALACLNLEEGKFGAAQNQLEELLLLDPGDSLGCRAMLPACYFERRRAPAVLELARKFPDEMLPDFVWSVILARFQMGQVDEARALLKIAAEHQRNILRIIRRGKKPTIRRGREDDDRDYAMGSVAEAADFWRSYSRFWLETPGAVEFVKAFDEGEMGARCAGTIS
ncbi:MAG TPA: hypothetical protein PLY73_00085 [Candidatus Ozemobacteraceae bacterium]|nr:hypothetical protein [Candidatus Ozemobacteraceae bacterium]